MAINSLIGRATSWLCQHSHFTHTNVNCLSRVHVARIFRFFLLLQPMEQKKFVPGLPNIQVERVTVSWLIRDPAYHSGCPERTDQLQTKQLHGGCGECFWLSQGLLEMPEDMHGGSECIISQFIISACVLHSICKAKGDPLPESLLQRMEWPPAPTDALWIYKWALCVWHASGMVLQTTGWWWWFIELIHCTQLNTVN